MKAAAQISRMPVQRFRFIMRSKCSGCGFWMGLYFFRFRTVLSPFFRYLLLLYRMTGKKQVEFLYNRKTPEP